MDMEHHANAIWMVSNRERLEKKHQAKFENGHTGLVDVKRGNDCRFRAAIRRTWEPRLWEQ